MADQGFEKLKALAETNPEEFRRLMHNVQAKTVVPHAGQLPILESTARFKVVNSGRRFGKTTCAAKMLVAKSRKKNQMLWWVAPTYKVVKRGYAEILKQLPDGVLTHTPPPESNFDAGRSVILRLKNGTKIELYSAERPEGMLGAGVDFVVMDEAGTMPSRIWNQIVSPTLIDRLGEALMIGTPRGRNWFYQSWQKGQDPQQPDWESWTFTTEDNPTLPPGEAARMAADLPRLTADQEIYAKFLAAGSSTFWIGDKATQIAPTPLDNGLIEGFAPAGYVVLGVDLARTNDYTVFYGARASDRRNCYFERMQAITWPEQKRRLRRAVRTLMRAGAENVMLVIDSTGVGDPIVEDMEAEGYDVVPINFTTHKANMVKLLAKDLEENKAFILDEGKLEFENYTMAITPGGRMTYSAPEGEHDDVVAAKMLQHWGLINEGVPEVQMIGAGETDVDDLRDPWDIEYDEEGDPIEESDFSDLLDDFDADEAIGLAPAGSIPTTQELLAHADVWLK